MSQNVLVQEREQRGAEERAALLVAWKKSGMSAQAFERQHGLSKSSLWRWRQGSGMAKKGVSTERSAVSFAPVHIAKAQEAVANERVVAEVLLGREVRVRVLDGADMNQVTQLVRALAGGL